MANLMVMDIGQRKKVFKMGSMKDGGLEEGQDMVFYLEKKGYMQVFILKLGPFEFFKPNGWGIT